MKSGNTSSDNLRGLAQVTFFACLCVWQTFPTLIGMVLFILLVRILRIDWRWLASVGGLMGVGAVVMMAAFHQLNNFVSIGWQLNMYWWHLGLFGHRDILLQEIWRQGFFYVMTIPPPMVGIMALMELIPGSAYEQQMRALQRGNVSSSSPASERPSTSLERTLERLSDAQYDATVLGISASSGRPVVMPDANVNQLALVLGTTGGGKTVTLRRFYRRAMLANYPLIIVDGKPTAENQSDIVQGMIGMDEMPMRPASSYIVRCNIGKVWLSDEAGCDINRHMLSA